MGATANGSAHNASTSSGSLHSPPFPAGDGPPLSASQTFPPRAGESPQGEGFLRCFFLQGSTSLPQHARRKAGFFKSRPGVKRAPMSARNQDGIVGRTGRGQAALPLPLWGRRELVTSAGPTAVGVS